MLPKAGTKVTDLHLLRLSDNDKADFQLGSSGLPTVVYVLSSTCKWCGINEKNVSSLSDGVQGKYRLIGILTQRDKEDSATQARMHFPLYYADEGASSYPITLAVTPRTLVFSPAGDLLRDWEGAYVGPTRSSVASYFGVSFPSVGQ